MATITQTKLVGFGYGNKSNYNATTYANHIWFDPTNKQILLNGTEYIPKNLSELVNDSGFLNSANLKIESTSVTAVRKITIGSYSGQFYTYDEGISGNMVLASATSSGTTTGATFRKLVEADIPTLAISKISGLQTVLDDRVSGSNQIYVSHPLYITEDGMLKQEPTISLLYDNSTLVLDGLTNKLKVGTIAQSQVVGLSDTLGSYLPLSGGTLTGNLTCNGSYIMMSGLSGATGYRGYFNQGNTSKRGQSTHLFATGSEGYGTYSSAIGAYSIAGLRNEDSSKPYCAVTKFPNLQFAVRGTNYYLFEVTSGRTVDIVYNGETYFYTNDDTDGYEHLVCIIKGDDILAASATPFNFIGVETPGGIATSGQRLYSITNIGEGIFLIGVRTEFMSEKYINIDAQCYTHVFTKSKLTNLDSYRCLALGGGSVANGRASISGGINSIASGYGSLAFGTNSFTIGNYSLATGYNSMASGSYSMALGENSVSSGTNSISFGIKSVAKHINSCVFGYRCTSGTYFQTVIGRTNAPTADAFVIGNGSSDQVSDTNAVQSNCFAVDWSGNVTARYFSGYANATGGEGFKIYPENTNQINFGGTGSDTIIVFGAASKDSRSAPTTYKFGADGTAKLQAAIATASDDGLMSSSMYMASVVKDLAVSQGSAMIGADGKPTDNGIFIRTSVSNLAGDATFTIDPDGIKIPNATAEFDGSMSYRDRKKLIGIDDNCVAASVYVMNYNSTINNIDGLVVSVDEFANLSSMLASGNVPDMIRLVLANTSHIFTLYEATKEYDEGSFYYYRCDGRNAMISIENNEVSFSIN